MIDEKFEESWPYIIPTDDSSNVGKWVNGHQDELDALDDNIDAVVDSHQILNASGDDLDQIGELFGVLGKIQGRSDSEYRQTLLALYAAVISTGRTKDIRETVATVTLVEKSKISAPENTTSLEYDVVVEDWARKHAVSLVRESAELADASVVVLDEIRHKLYTVDDPLRDLWRLSDGSIQLSDGKGSLAQRVAEMRIGDGTDESASGMQNVLYTANKSGALTETRVGPSEYELSVEVTGGQEVPAGATLTEFGVAATGANTRFVNRQVREGVTLESGESTTIVQPVKYLRATN